LSYRRIVIQGGSGVGVHGEGIEKQLSPHQKVMAMLSAAGLDFIHSRRLLHGNVKPSNLLVGGFFDAKNRLRHASRC
jgi:serine/threonine protein kinase